jgi:hypothetical protein
VLYCAPLKEGVVLKPNAVSPASAPNVYPDYIRWAVPVLALLLILSLLLHLWTFVTLNRTRSLDFIGNKRSVVSYGESKSKQHHCAWRRLMITYTALVKQPRIFQNFTGLTPVAFRALAPAFAQAYTTLLHEREAQRATPRRRQLGAGRHPTLLTTVDPLLFIRFYFTFYPTQEVQGFLFGMSHPQANVWIHLLTHTLNRARGAAQPLPARQASSLTQVLEACPALEFIIDGTERPIQRPDAARQQNY